jgi:hypothetical protein
MDSNAVGMKEDKSESVIKGLLNRFWNIGANEVAIKEEEDKSESIIKGLLNRFWKKKNSKKEEYSSQVHPTIPHELSQAWEAARPYRPCLVPNLQTIREEDDPSKTPFQEDPPRTPVYFPKGTNAKRFRFRLRRYTKLIWRMHYAARLRRNFSSVFRVFRTSRDTKVPADSGFSIIQRRSRNE